MCVAAVLAAVLVTPSPPLQPPEVLFGPLFAAVQMDRIYPDGKTFVDALPKAAPQQILAEYERRRPDSPEALKSFVQEYFAPPAEAVSAPSPPERVPILTHIDRLWNVLMRRTVTVPPYSSALTLPYPYVVPGGRFREMYYWDSYFTMLGLEESGRGDLVEDMVRDFASLIDRFGHVPNGTRSYYLSRSQPPFFFAMVGLLGGNDPAAAFARYLPELEREYDYWMEGAQGLPPGKAHRHVVALADGDILNRYWDDRDTPRDESFREDTEVARKSGRDAAEVYRDLRAAAESGWDFGSRWFEDGRSRERIDTTQIVPVDLNSLLFGLETAIAAGCARAGDRPCAARFAQLAARRRRAVDRHLWNRAAGTYLDYRWTREQSVPRVSAATLYPLFVGLASRSQAAAVARTAARQLLQPGGLVTTPVTTGQQWDAPNGWAPLQWVAIDGLRRSGESELAETIACRWMHNVLAVYGEDGKLVEKYDVVSTGRKGGGGEYPLQDGFGWTNGVMRKLMALYPQFVSSSGGACH